MLAIINAKGPHDQKLVESARETLKTWAVPVAKTVISSRIAYVSAITLGKTGPELNSDARKEINALWDEVEAALAKTRRRK